MYTNWEKLKDSIPKKISTADFYFNNKKLPTKKSRQLEAAGTNPPETAGEEDSLMGRLAKRMASRDYIDKQNLGFGTKAKSADTADTADMQDTIRHVPGKLNLGGYDPNEVKTGIKIEHEHKDTVDKVKAGKIKSNNEAYKEITLDHLKEHKDYYDKTEGLPAMEKKLESQDTESITPYWEKLGRITGKELDQSGHYGQHKHQEDAFQGAPGGNYSDPIKTELVMPGANMADQAKNTGRVIGRKFL